MRMPECLILWRLLTEISSAVSCSRMRAISRSPQSTGRRPGMRRISSATSSLALRSSPAISTSSSIAIDGIRERGGADGVEAPTRPSRRAAPSPPPAAAADPCQTPSVRVARPPIAAASGTVASTSIGLRLERVAQVVEVLGLGAERHREHDGARARSRPPRSAGPRRAASAAPASVRARRTLAGGLRARARRRASRSRSARRRSPSARASPKPSAPVPPMTATVCLACAISSRRATSGEG